MGCNRRRWNHLLHIVDSRLFSLVGVNPHNPHRNVVRVYCCALQPRPKWDERGSFWGQAELLLLIAAEPRAARTKGIYVTYKTGTYLAPDLLPMILLCIIHILSPVIPPTHLTIIKERWLHLKKIFNSLKSTYYMNRSIEPLVNKSNILKKSFWKELRCVVVVIYRRLRAAAHASQCHKFHLRSSWEGRRMRSQKLVWFTQTNIAESKLSFSLVSQNHSSPNATPRFHSQVQFIMIQCLSLTIWTRHSKVL